MILGILLLLSQVSWGSSKVIFLGDVQLAREVATELRLKKGRSPWANFPFPSGARVVANLEGAVGKSSDCKKKKEYCFAVDESHLSLLKDAGISTLGIENNHAHDLGPTAPIVTADKLTHAKLTSFDFERSPFFINERGTVISLIALNYVDRTPTLTELKQKFRMARQLSDWVVAYVHWGRELIPFPDQTQKDIASLLIAEGADLIVGHHPHVIQTQSCVENKPVYYSLGNHLFDQKYPSTHKGLALECDFTPNSFNCEGKETQRDRGSSSPHWTKVTNPQLPCGKRVKNPQSSGRRWRAVDLEQGRVLLNLEKSFVHYQSSEFSLRYFSPIDLGDGRKSFFLGHVAFSTFDDKAALRPAVYVEKDNRLVPVWKGTTLAYPVKDFELVSSGGVKVLCAFHGPVGHFLGKSTPSEERIMVYKWNGFGFSKDPNTAHLESCMQWARQYAYQ